MGINISKDAPKTLDEVKDLVRSKVDIAHIREWYQKFEETYEEGFITKAQLKKVYVKLFPTGNSAQFAADNYEKFALDDDGTINLREFTVQMSFHAGGRIDEKMKWIHGVFDNGEGVITKDDMSQILISLHKSLGQEEESPEETDEEVTKLFGKLDENEDDLLTLEEFMNLM